MFWDLVAVLGSDESVHLVDIICGEEGRLGTRLGWVSDIYIGEIDYVRNTSSLVA